MSDLPKHVLRLDDQRQRRETEFTLAPEAGARAAIVEELGIRGLRKLRFAGRLVPEGRRDWRLEADLGATVVQDCVATLEPVTTRIEERVARRYLEHPPEPEGAGEVEMPDDDTAEPLPGSLDVAAVMVEALALALPAWPRADAAPPADAEAVPPGAAPIDEEEVRPFAGLAGLRDRLGGGTEDDGSGNDGTEGER